MERDNQIESSNDKKHCTSCCYKEFDHISTPWFMVIAPKKSNKEKNAGRSVGTKNKKAEGKFITVSILFAVIIIVLIDALCIFTACSLLLKNPDLEKTEAVFESSLLSSGLSIIGIAISVWAALNIINALDKKDFEALKEKYELLHNEQEKRRQELEEENERQKNQQQENNKNLFIGELIKNIADYSTELLVEKMGIITATSNIPFVEMIRVEQLFSNVYQLHERKKNDKNLEKTASEGMRCAKELLSKLEKKADIPREILLYLSYRIGEFCFYKAYCKNVVATEVKTLFEKAINQYENSMDLFNIRIPNFDADKEYPDIVSEESPENRKISYYMCNTIGEAYSKIIERSDSLRKAGVPEDLLALYGKKAVFYCTYAVVWSDYKIEKYLRNLGCALERVYGEQKCTGKNAVRISDIYQKAMNASVAQAKIPEKVFYTWLSFNRKYSNYIIGQIRTRKGDQWLNTKDELVDEALIQKNSCAISYAKLAMETYRDNLVYQKFYAFTLRDACLWHILNEKTKEACDFFAMFAEVAEKLMVFYPQETLKDDFVREIITYLDEISKYWGK